MLGWDIQADDGKGHSSVEDARATMELFKREKGGFEREAVRRFGVRARGVGGRAGGLESLPGGTGVAYGRRGEAVDEIEGLEDEESEVGETGGGSGANGTVGRKSEKKKKKKKTGKK